jgi:hypothetical protein
METCLIHTTIALFLCVVILHLNGLPSVYRGVLRGDETDEDVATKVKFWERWAAKGHVVCVAGGEGRRGIHLPLCPQNIPGRVVDIPLPRRRVEPTTLKVVTGNANVDDEVALLNKMLGTQTYAFDGWSFGTLEHIVDDYKHPYVYDTGRQFQPSRPATLLYIWGDPQGDEDVDLQTFLNETLLYMEGFTEVLVVRKEYFTYSDAVPLLCHTLGDLGWDMDCTPDALAHARPVPRGPPALRLKSSDMTPQQAAMYWNIISMELIL